MGVATLAELKPSISGRRTLRPSASTRNFVEWYISSRKLCYRVYGNVLSFQMTGFELSFQMTGFELSFQILMFILIIFECREF